MQHFSQVCNTVPHIELARVIFAFCNGMHDKDMLDELGVHYLDTVTHLFQLMDMCPLHQEAQAWHGPAPKPGSDSSPKLSKYQRKKLLKKHKSEEVLATGSLTARANKLGQAPA